MIFPSCSTIARALESRATWHSNPVPTIYLSDRESGMIVTISGNLVIYLILPKYVFKWDNFLFNIAESLLKRRLSLPIFCSVLKSLNLWSIVSVVYQFVNIPPRAVQNDPRLDPPKETDWIRSDSGWPDYFNDWQQIFNTRNWFRWVNFSFPPLKPENPKPIEETQSPAKISNFWPIFPDSAKKTQILAKVF